MQYQQSYPTTHNNVTIMVYQYVLDTLQIRKFSLLAQNSYECNLDRIEFTSLSYVTWVLMCTAYICTCVEAATLTQ